MLTAATLDITITEAAPNRLRRDNREAGISMMTKDSASIGDLLDSFDISLAAQRKSPATRSSYGTAVRQFASFTAARHGPTDVAAIRREDVEAFIIDLLNRWKPTTAHNRYRGLHTFFAWVVREEIIGRSPMDGMSPPSLPEAPPPVLRDEQLAAILAACARDRTPIGRRDEALVRFLIDTGCRRAEVAGLRTGDVDLRSRTATVTGKGDRTRLVAYSVATAEAIDRWLRARRTFPRAADTDALWVGHKGPMGIAGVRFVVALRGRDAGIPHLNPHAFRHAWAHRASAAHMSESNIMALAGWRTSEMLRRYAASTRSERAAAEARRLMFGEDA
jgi:site-specific recombinase XerD